MNTAEKTAPVQGYAPGIPWSLHLEAYDAYSKKWRPQPAMIEDGCRGGFHVDELDEFIPGWRDRASEIAKLKAQIAALTRAAEAAAHAAPQPAMRQVGTVAACLRDGTQLRKYEVTNGAFDDLKPGTYELFAAVEAPAACAPIDMVLHCPACGLQHIDAPEPELGPNVTGDGDMPLWNNPPHRSHLCAGCGHVWRPADVATNGVRAVKTGGKDDSPPALPIRVRFAYVKGVIEQRRAMLSKANADAARFEWLTADHADPAVRAACRGILDRMGVMSYSNACAEIDAHLPEVLA